MAQLVQNRLCKGETHYFEVRADTDGTSYRASFGGRARVTTGLYRSTSPSRSRRLRRLGHGMERERKQAHDDRSQSVQSESRFHAARARAIARGVRERNASSCLGAGWSGRSASDRCMLFVGGHRATNKSERLIAARPQSESCHSWCRIDGTSPRSAALARRRKGRRSVGRRSGCREKSCPGTRGPAHCTGRSMK